MKEGVETVTSKNHKQDPVIDKKAPKEAGLFQTIYLNRFIYILLFLFFSLCRPFMLKAAVNRVIGLSLLSMMVR
jgi:hypothetical protein